MRSILLASAATLLLACAEAAADPQTDTATGTDATHTHDGTTHTHADLSARNPQIPTLESIVDPQLTVDSLNASMDVLVGSGGNVLVLYGQTGALLVDDKYARNADEILARVNARAGVLPVFVLNTHYHGDHTGSNAEMREVGALVIAQEGARALMSRDIENQLFDRTVEARAPSAHPNMTFRSELNLDFADQAVRMIHVPNAHTGGDMLVHFPDSDVLHMGDNHFNGMFPYVDIDSGGSLQGMITAQNAAIRMADPDTVVVPGHGPVTDRAGLQASHDQLVLIRDRMQARIDAGDTLETVLAADIYADLGMDEGFINNERMARIAYRSLSERRPVAVSE